MGVGMGAKSLKDHLRDGSFSGSRHAHLLVFDAELEREFLEVREADRVWFENDKRLRADLPWLHERYLAGASYADLAREFAADYGVKNHTFADRLARRFSSAGFATRIKSNFYWRERVSDDECFDVAARLGIAAAAVELGVSQSAICSRLKDLGWSERYRQARRDNGFAATTTVAELLNVCSQTVVNMVSDGRLSDPIDIDAVRSAVACTTLTVYQEKSVKGRQTPKVCVGCERLFTDRRRPDGRRAGRGKFCTPECRHQYFVANRPAKTEPALRRRWPQSRLTKPRLFTFGACLECAEQVVVLGGPRSASGYLFCSETCAKRTRRRGDKAKRRGLFRPAPYSPQQVYERDRWKCGICRGPIDPSIKAPDRMAASIDHIHPGSFDGPDTIHNVRAAHIGCNSSRGNRDEFQTTLAIEA